MARPRLRSGAGAARGRPVGARARGPTQPGRSTGARADARAARLGNHSPRAAVTHVAPALELQDVAARAKRIVDELEGAIVGKREALDLALAALLHVGPR